MLHLVSVFGISKGVWSQETHRRLIKEDRNAILRTGPSVDRAHVTGRVLSCRRAKSGLWDVNSIIKI